MNSKAADGMMPPICISEQLFEPSDRKTGIFNNSTQSDCVHRIVSWNSDEMRAVAHYDVLAWRTTLKPAFSNALIARRRLTPGIFGIVKR
jgi:hypothetical protein